MGNQSKCANELHEKTFPKTKTRVFRNGQWYTHTLMTNDTVNIPNKPYGYSPNDRNVLWSWHYNLKPGATICTNGGTYKCRYIYVQRENVLRRELRPVYDPTDAFNVNKAKREAKRTVPTVGYYSAALKPEFTRQATATPESAHTVLLERKITILRNRIGSNENKLRVCRSTIKTLRAQLQKQRKFRQDARRVHLSFQAEHQAVQDMNQQEMSHLKADNNCLRNKITKLKATNESVFTNLLYKMQEIAKCRKLHEGYKQCIDKQKHEIRILKANPEFRQIGRCMRSFDMFCDINASSAAQALSTPGSQLMKTTRFISRTAWCTLLCLTSYAGILWAWQLDAMRRDDS